MELTTIKNSLGILLVLIGILFQVILLWNEMKKSADGLGTEDEETPGYVQILLALIEKLPWLSIAGFLLIYAGMKFLRIEF